MIHSIHSRPPVVAQEPRVLHRCRATPRRMDLHPPQNNLTWHLHRSRHKGCNLARRRFGKAYESLKLRIRGIHCLISGNLGTSAKRKLCLKAHPATAVGMTAFEFHLCVCTIRVVENRGAQGFQTRLDWKHVMSKRPGSCTRGATKSNNIKHISLTLSIHIHSP